MSSRNQFLTNQFGDRYLPDINPHSFNQIGSAAVFGKTFGDAFKTPDTFYIIAGTDSGLLINYIKKTGIPKGSRFLFVELPGVIEQLPNHIWETDSRITVCGIDEWEEQATRFGLQGYLFINKTRIVRSIAVLDAHHAGYAELFHRLQIEFNQQKYAAQASLGSKIFIQRQLETVGDNLLPAKMMQGWGRGKSCVLLAGGPSLDDFLPWLNRHSDRFIIIAVSRIARRLQQERITPDIWCSIDPWTANMEVSKEMLFQHENTLLVNANHIYPPLLGQWMGKSLYLGDRFPWKTSKNRPNIAVAPIQVTNSALSLAMEMEFSQIILAGVDFCYHRDGHSHARGSLDYETGHQLSPVDTCIETNSGHMAETTFPLAASASVFENLAKPAAKKGITIINPAPGAAKMESIAHVPVGDIPLPPLMKKGEKQIHLRVHAMSTEERLQHYQEILEELSRTDGELKNIKTLSARALKYHHDTCSPVISDGKKLIQKRRIEKIEKKINSRYKATSRLVKTYGIHGFLEMGIVDRDRIWSDHEIRHVGKTYYESYYQTSSELIELLESARKRVISRIEELKDNPDFSALARQWRKDSQPGRALVWKKQHKSTPGKQFDKLLAELEEEFKYQLENASDIKGFHDGTSYLDRLRSIQQDLTGIFYKINHLFQLGNREGIKRTIAGLKKLDSKEAHRLTTLAEGYLSELEGDLDKAMEFYLQMVEEEPPVQVLVRVSDIALRQNDYDTATLALEVLSKISVAFMPSYANILRLTGKKPEALRIYHDYLDKMPEDLATVIAVGRFYLELGAMDAATDAFCYVLERDPGNHAARALLKEFNLKTG